MKDLIRQFLRKHLQGKGPLLLGLSGGGDSMALLYLLLECHQEFSFDIHALHVDHGWREESKKQAKELQLLVERLGVPIFVSSLEKSSLKNLEEEARKARLRIFQKKYQEGGYQALLLAHQADDQAETVLKRILEGARWSACGGMRPVSMLQGMQVWRPLLSIFKEELVLWLKAQGKEWIEDPTNRDPQFLRGRMRTQLFPFVETYFGKKIGRNLLKFAKTAQEMQEYLEKKTASYFEAILRSEKGVCLDTSVLHLDSFELKFLLHKFLQKEGETLSYEAFETLFDLVVHQARNRKVGKCWIDRGKVFLPDKLSSFC